MNKAHVVKMISIIFYCWMVPLPWGGKRTKDTVLHNWPEILFYVPGNPMHSSNIITDL